MQSILSQRVSIANNTPIFMQGIIFHTLIKFFWKFEKEFVHFLTKIADLYSTKKAE